MIRTDMHNEAVETPGDLRELAHELRSPLGGLEAMAELLSRTALTADQARMIAAMQAAAAHLRAVADRVLDGGHRAPRAAPTPALRLIESLAIAASARARAKGLAFRLDIQQGDPNGGSLDSLVVAEPVAFRQVIENLVDNAVRASESGTLTLAFRSRLPVEGDSRPEEQARLIVTLADEGRGLSAAHAARLIAGGGSIPGIEGGAGLGLALSGRLVASLGGHLAGGPGAGGRGARFAFDWPAMVGEDAMERFGPEPASGGFDAVGNGNPPSPEPLAEVLVVDDHPASRLVVSTILRAFRLRAHEACSVAEARDLLARLPFRAVFTDLCLGEDDGRDLIRLIGAMPESRRPKLVVISADALDPGSDCASLVDAEVIKPVSVQAIAEAVRAVGLGQSDAAEQGCAA